MANTKKTTIYAPSEVILAIKQLAGENNRSFNSEVVTALEEHIKQQQRKAKRKAE